MLEWLTGFDNTALYLLRLVVAVIFIVHALPKLTRSGMMAEGMGMKNMVWAVILLGVVEGLSALGLVFGFYIQLSALLLAIVMVGAIGAKAMLWKTPFTAFDKTGWEFDLIILAVNLVILTTAGKLS